jgi:hypothetical protein
LTKTPGLQGSQTAMTCLGQGVHLNGISFA